MNPLRWFLPVLISCFCVLCTFVVACGPAHSDENYRIKHLAEYGRIDIYCIDGYEVYTNFEGGMLYRRSATDTKVECTILVEKP